MKIIFNLRYCWQDFGTKKNKISIVADFVLALRRRCPCLLLWWVNINIIYYIVVLYYIRYDMVCSWTDIIHPFLWYTVHITHTHIPSTLYETHAHLSGVYRIIIVMWPQRCNTQERTQNKKKDPFIILFIYSQNTLSCEIECFAMLCAHLSACIYICRYIYIRIYGLYDILLQNEYVYL